MMSCQYSFLKLRANIILSGDIDLAERELNSFFKNIERVSDPSTVETKLGLSSDYAILHSRKNGCIGFIAYNPYMPYNDLVRLLNFFQEIWLENHKDTQLNNFIDNKQWAYLVNCNDKKFICLLPFMACGELLSQTKLSTPTVNDIGCITGCLANSKGTKCKTIKAPTSGGTSTQHVHSIHKYKAKFFPRLIRSFLVQNLKILPKNRDGNISLLDPFVGSGTALVEASLLGVNSVGVDIDLLSCAISEAKIKALNISPKRVESSAKELNKIVAQSSAFSPSAYKFPKQIARKFERWGALDEQIEYEKSITKWINAINRVGDNEVKQLFKILLSDALTRKFVIRMMGTGVGRFALEITKTSLDTLIFSNLKSLIKSCYDAQSLIGAYDISLGKATVHHGTAVNLSLDSSCISTIITSPPYLPASSGREDYLVGKAISCLALDLMTDDEIEAAEKASVGSMKRVIENGEGLPTAVYELHDWLLNDSLREIKAKPTLAYYMSLKHALEESYRVLMKNGLAFYIIGKESVFYKFSSREVLYKVECDKIFAELAMSSGFKIEEQVNVELKKKNMNARPRSLDSFYESVFVLKKT